MSLDLGAGTLFMTTDPFREQGHPNSGCRGSVAEDME